jgi:tellurite resistance protein
MLLAVAALPNSRATAEVLFGIGAAFTRAFPLWRTGLLWRGGRDPSTTTPVLYLPTVAGGFVTATAASALGYQEMGGSLRSASACFRGLPSSQCCFTDSIQ